MTEHRCLFCADADRPANSAEHLISKPVADVFGLDRQDRSIATVELGDGGLALRRLDGSLDQARVRYVCTTCNTGWMSLLEREAANVFAAWVRNQRRILTHEDAAVLTRWVIKTHFTVLALAGEFRGELGTRSLPNATLAKSLWAGTEAGLRDCYLVTAARREEGASFAHYLSNPRTEPFGRQSATTVALGLGPIEVRSTIALLSASIRHPHGTPIGQGIRLRSIDRVRFPIATEPSGWVDFGASRRH